MPYKDKSKRNEYQRNYKRKQAAELKALRQKLDCSVQKEGKQE